jgi:hypothetical protein
MKRQRGVTFVGMIFIAGIIVFVAIIGLKLVPAYIDYATIRNHVREVARSPEARSGNLRDVQVAFMKRIQIDNISVVTPEDLEVVKDGSGVILTVSYSNKIQLFGNVSACIDFVATSEGQ